MSDHHLLSNQYQYNNLLNHQMPTSHGYTISNSSSAAAADNSHLWKQHQSHSMLLQDDLTAHQGVQFGSHFDPNHYHLPMHSYTTTTPHLDPASLDFQQQQLGWQQMHQQYNTHLGQPGRVHSNSISNPSVPASSSAVTSSSSSGRHRRARSSVSHISIPAAPSNAAPARSPSALSPTSATDVNNSLFQAFENTSTSEPHFLYCKKCALLKPAVEFASTTGFFNNNCKHCRNYRRKGEDAKSEAVQEIYRVASYEQFKSTLSECIHSRRVRNAPLVCVHFYLDLNFIGDQQTHEPISNARFLTPEGRSALANMLIKQVRTVDNYSYNHRSTRVFKSGETHKYLCSQSTALPWRQKKKGPNGEIEYTDPDLYNCGGTILVKFQSPGEQYQRVCVAYCHDVSHPPKTARSSMRWLRQSNYFRD